MGVLETLRDRYPVETAVGANCLYAVAMCLTGDLTVKATVGMVIQSLAMALLGRNQRINMQATTGQNEAIAQNQAAMAAADTSIPTSVVAAHMAPRTAETALKIAAQLPPSVEVAKERHTNGVSG